MKIKQTIKNIYNSLDILGSMILSPTEHIKYYIYGTMPAKDQKLYSKFHGVPEELPTKYNCGITMIGGIGKIMGFGFLHEVSPILENPSYIGQIWGACAILESTVRLTLSKKNREPVGSPIIYTMDKLTNKLKNP
jgi:hypothetical protein